MKKIGLVFDSSCGFSKEKVEKDNNLFFPLVIQIDDKKYKAGVDIDSDDVFKKMVDRDIKIQTASPELQDIYNAFKKGLEKFEKLVYIGLSAKFSSTLNNARVVVEEYPEFKDKVFIYDSTFSSPWTNFYYNSLMKLVETETNINKIFKILDDQKAKMVGFLSPGDIYWFYKGGRITRQQYIAANVLNIRPILTIRNGEIDQKNIEKAFSIKKTISKMMAMLDKEIKKGKKNNWKVKFMIVNDPKNKKMQDLIMSSLKEAYNAEQKDIVQVKTLSAEQSAHMGPDSFGLGIFSDIEF